MIIVALEVRANFPLTIASRLGTKKFSNFISVGAFIRLVSSSSQTDRAAAYISMEAGLLCLSLLFQIRAGVSFDRAIEGEGMYVIMWGLARIFEVGFADTTAYESI